MGEPAPIDLGTLSEAGQMAVALITQVVVRAPITAEVIADLRKVRDDDVPVLDRALLTFGRLFHLRTSWRARAAGATTLRLTEVGVPGDGLLFQDDGDLRQMSSDVVELFEAWLADEASTAPLADRYSRRWGIVGSVRLAMTVAALLPPEPEVWDDLRWAVARVRRLERGLPLT